MIPFRWIGDLFTWVFGHCGDCDGRFSWRESPVYRHVPHDGSYPAHYECRDLR